MKIQQVIDCIIKETGVILDQERTVDQVIIGDPEQEATKIVSTFMATVEVIREAIQLGANFIITHEPTWFNGRDRKDWLLKDPVYQLKKRLIEENGLVIWRFHDYMHSVPEDMIYQGFDEDMGWKSYHTRQQAGNTGKNPLLTAPVCYEIPETNLNELVCQVRDSLEVKGVRVIGNSNAVCKRIGVLVGGGSLGLGDERNTMELVHKENLDTVICGDITEWTLSAYIRDAMLLGFNRSMIIIGHERSEESGMKHLVGWLQKLLPEEEILFVDAKEPFDYVIGETL
ncbi:Nif3-like dinuclear metal center hexameric protein [Clostridium sp. E02]|uniref:Nif3-like dinuclear metal center hexameric protein n=1 Tax=Clostridium sp. E02 TaxID=2487134 RepID=UPI000F530785|nr:Nif3-like dinuclear metal center hexameric protein [Clostridium sp. E02]